MPSTPLVLVMPVLLTVLLVLPPPVLLVLLDMSSILVTVQLVPITVIPVPLKPNVTPTDVLPDILTWPPINLVPPPSLPVKPEVT
jgi:hypothetical protein